MFLPEAPPYLTFFSVLVALLLSLASTLANSKIVDKQLLTTFRKEIAEWQAEMKRVKETGDKRLMAKLKKQELRIMQMRAKVSSQQMKVMLITFIPFIAVWWFLIPYLYKPAASVPLLGTRVDIPFYIWYVICFFFFQRLFSKIFNI